MTDRRQLPVQRSAALRLLVAWVGAVARHPVVALAAVAALVVSSTIYSAGRIQMNSDSRQLVRQDAPFRVNYSDYLESFPEFQDMTLVVLSGDSIDATSDAQRRLAAALRGRTELIANVHAPGADSFFEDRALLYLDEDGLERVVERLAQAQPALAALTEDPSLRGLFGEIAAGVDRLGAGESIPPGFLEMADLVTEIGESMLAGEPHSVSWSDQVMDHDGEVYRLITLQGRQDFTQAVPAQRLIDEIRRTADQIGVTPENGVSLRLTGMVPLAHEELASLRQGLVLAGTISLVLLSLILGVGVHSLRIIVGTFVSLAVSISLTTSYAMLTVGEFNTVSAAFAVLLLGIGVDFAIHLGLRYEEEMALGLSRVEALESAAGETGGPVSLCALTSAIGFASFIPTEYRGLAALGVIAAGGMLFCFLTSYTVLPAILALGHERGARDLGLAARGAVLQRLVEAYAGPIVASAAVLAVGAIYLSTTGTTFDFSTLGLKDPESESMTTLHELHEREIVTDYSVTALSKSLASSELLAADLIALDQVAEVRPPSHFVPADQDTKLEMLSDAAFFLEPVLYAPPPRAAPTEAERIASIQDLQDKIGALDGEVPPSQREPLRRLDAVLAALLADANRSRIAADLERLVVADLAEQIDWLRRALSVDRIEFADLPESLRNRLVARDGRALVAALPSEDVSEIEALGRFVSAVTSVAPRATGRPVVEHGIGRIVVRSFQIAISISLISIFFVLVLRLRSFSDSALVLTPITLAAFFTVALGGVFGIHFNMANVVAVPLVLGLGVDSGIHVFMRFHRNRSLEEMITSTTPRAVMLSALTTLAAFASLSSSPHRGLSSLGSLLAISVLCLLYCTLVVLPAMILVRDRWRRRSRSTRPPVPV